MTAADVAAFEHMYGVAVRPLGVGTRLAQRHAETCRIVIETLRVQTKREPYSIVGMPFHMLCRHIRRAVVTDIQAALDDLVSTGDAYNTIDNSHYASL